MKKYLLGLGAMLIGAGLMFVFPHTEVSAYIKDSSSSCEILEVKTLRDIESDGKKVFRKGRFMYCKIKDLTCLSNLYSEGTMSCVKS